MRVFFLYPLKLNDNEQLWIYVLTMQTNSPPTWLQIINNGLAFYEFLYIYTECPERSECAANHDNICPTRTMVFVLDTSGSIGRANFQRMTTAISNFVPLLCDNIQLAIVSHSHSIRTEFCFNCHDLCNQPRCLIPGGGREHVISAIRNIRYRGGLTYTGVTTRCVRDYVLNPNWGCGVNTSSECLDVIYVTDGQSNGPLRYPQTCNEATCLKNHPDWCGRVNTYAIAIGSGVNQNEIACLTQHDEDSVFNVGNFEEFEQLVSNAQNMLFNPHSAYSDNICVQNRDRLVLLE